MQTTPWVTRLLALNVAIFFAVATLPGLRPLFAQLALVPSAVLVRPWTPFTYMWLHGGIGHLFFNMLALFFFGPRLEQRLGGPHFLALYLVSGLGGAALSFVDPLHVGTVPSTPIVGASGAIYGVILAYALIWPHDRVMIWGVLPLEVRMMVLLTAGYAIWAGFTGASRGTAHFAHLGGYVGAYLYLAWADRKSASRQFRRRVDTALYGRPTPVTADEPRWGAIKRDGLHPLNLEELDRLQAKVRDHGPSSLTPDERAFLHRLSLR
jgi:membrane associated rhomboid family serine protease